MTPFASVVDNSAERAGRYLAAIRRAPRIAMDMKGVLFAQTDSAPATRALRDLLCVNGISFMATPHGLKMSFECHPDVYADARAAIIANTAQLRERAEWREYLFDFQFK